jgi:hypothetical protein
MKEGRGRKKGGGGFPKPLATMVTTMKATTMVTTVMT